MQIYLEHEDETISMDYEGTILDLLKKLKINKNVVVVDVNGKIAEHEDTITNKDKIKILDVVTGG